MEDFISVAKYAERCGLSERTIRNYCTQGKIPGAFLTGKTWNIPSDAALPARKYTKRVSPLLARLMQEKTASVKGGIYHRTMIDLTFNTNHIEGSKLTHEQTRFIYETNTIGVASEDIPVDDIIETVNHFKCIDYVLENAGVVLSEKIIKQLHSVLKTGTVQSRLPWFAVGEYKRLANEVGGIDTTEPRNVKREIKALLKEYNAIKSKTLEDIIDFHVRFERIHPFQDGNGRVGRLIMFKECLANDIVPFIVTDELKRFYYRGLAQWGHINEYLRDTILTAQDQYRIMMRYFGIE